MLNTISAGKSDYCYYCCHLWLNKFMLFEQSKSSSAYTGPNFKVDRRFAVERCFILRITCCLVLADMVPAVQVTGTRLANHQQQMMLANRFPLMS